jgi:hypothetical protein
MKNQREIDLLIDIAKLLRKYGPESFVSLAKTISSPEMVQYVTTILTQVVSITRTIPKTKRDFRPKEIISEPASLTALKITEPEKYQLLKNFYNDLIGKRVLLTTKDIKEFGVECGFPEIHTKSRKQAISLLIDLLIKLPVEIIMAKIQLVNKYDSGERSLEGWSNIILNRERNSSED